MATRAQLRSRSQVRADQDSATFVNDTLWNDLIDESAREVWYDLVQAGWPVKFTAQNISPGGAQYTGFGTANTAFVRAVYRVDGNQYYKLPRIAEGDRPGLLSTQSNQAQGYNIVMTSVGPSVELLPVTSGTYVVEYVDQFTGFSGDTEVWFGPARSDELIVLRTAIKAMRKEGNDQGADQLEKEYTRVYEKVTNMASWVDMGNPPTIVDSQRGRVRRDMSDYDVDTLMGL